MEQKLENEIKKCIFEKIGFEVEEIKNLCAMKNGMTNNSYIFSYNSLRYIIRIPGLGSDLLINRKDEYENYQLLKNFDFTDELIYINKDDGIKITKFIEDTRNCNPFNHSDLVLCINTLKKFHKKNFKVNHQFNLFDKIEYYEKLLGNKKSKYEDYDLVKKQVFELKEYIDSLNKKNTLCHIDSVCDNFLINKNNNVTMIDWEYGGMCDPDIDIAMFIIYSGLDKTKADEIIDIYYDNNCNNETKLKIYCYIASCGLLWSNWCEYKNMQGVCFGEYELIQYNYAKDYYNLFKEMRKK